MKTLTLIQPKTLIDEELNLFKCYLAISNDTLVVLAVQDDGFKVLEYIIVGSDTCASICEFNYIDDMLDVISIVLPIIRNKGHIYLEEHFNINL